MIPVKGYAAQNEKDPLGPWDFERREVGADDVEIDILYCGICHSDIHQVRSEWRPGIFPMVPGHEIVGRIVRVGSHAVNFKAGDLVGIGCMVDSCHECPSCKSGHEQFCEKGETVWTYNSVERDKKTPTYGGYSNKIVCNKDFVVRVSEKLDLKGVAPLLCAGITTYSPIKKWNIGKGHKVAVLGLGGLGHMAVKFLVALGAEVTLLSRSESKKQDAQRLGAHKFCNTKEVEQVQPLKRYFDYIIDTVSAPHDYDFYMSLLKDNGVHICVGLPPGGLQLKGLPFNRAITGSSIGGIPETQEMLDFCAEHQITSDVEVINISYVNEAYQRVLNSDVRYRFVIDMATL
ncbi:uncharacterized zinc-type alcohol dehydrogenase-like protein [Arachidicoccus rhizosphaerae]|uniref:Uncharacterized zinc-type alcohol dehydrogenase-like protein n=1 Tax=Arachidicoccus rhizosphaerae TaxID=551991 RepID=A0A1H3W9E3_9BACT|nr:NAD(P)-dependent alcohol dehydrogenase [Arachidicoccus rhizosphaerae]SDZ82962.1 uncharacterized zinc-type alcohol dehydrogenase-like protein [Arachidicoccus rhizosphaerae]